MNREARLFQPLSLNIDPRHGGINGSIKVGMVLVLDDAGVGTLPNLESPGVTNVG